MKPFKIYFFLAKNILLENSNLLKTRVSHTQKQVSTKQLARGIFEIKDSPALVYIFLQK